MERRFILALAWGQVIGAWFILLVSLFQFIRAMWCGADGFVVFCLMLICIVADKLRKWSTADLRKARKGEDDDAD